MMVSKGYIDWKNAIKHKCSQNMSIPKVFTLIFKKLLLKKMTEEMFAKNITPPFKIAFLLSYNS
jgi:hypothetical protein